jgi:uroporphyrinogen-III synthase
MAEQAKPSGLKGLRVLALESRRAPEMAKLITSYGGQAIVAPSMREVPIEANTEALDFARTLAAHGFDMVILLTGVGTRALARVVETVYSREQFVASLSRVVIVARGPKPVAVLKEIGVPVTIAVPEPNTWRDLLAALDEKRDSIPLDGLRVAVQEYGKPNPELLAGLLERGARVTRVPVYQWALPEDTGPLRAAVESIANDEVDIALFTTSIQVQHLLLIAQQQNREADVRRAFARIVVGSIGPVTSQELRDEHISADFEPPHPKMGFLVNEAAQRGVALLAEKRLRESR